MFLFKRAEKLQDQNAEDRRQRQRGIRDRGGTSQVSVGKVAVVDVPTSIPQQEQGSSGAEFNVVGMCEDGQDGGHGEIVPA